MKNKGKIFNYSLGATFKGPFTTLAMFFLIIGSIAILFSFIAISEITEERIPLFLILFFTALLIVGVAFPFAANIKGTLLDIENKRFKQYRTMILFKIGSWKPLGSFNELVLSKFVDTSTVRLSGVISGRISTRTYDLHLKSDYNNLFLKEFEDYQVAWKFLEEQGRILKIPTRDEIKINREKQMKKRRR